MTQGLFGEITTNGETVHALGRRDKLTFRGNVALGRHGWLRLTPAYSLHLVREILKTTGPADIVLDPFSGTGTTPLACASLGIRCHAVDINPFLVWLGNLKLMRFNDGTARAVKAAASRVAKKTCEIDSQSVGWKPSLHQIDKWWDNATLHALANLCEAIRSDTDEQAGGVSDLLNVAFCRVMIQSASVSFAHQSMSFKKNCRDEGLIKESQVDVTACMANAFLNSAAEIAQTLSVDPPAVDCRVFQGDSRMLPEVLPKTRPRYTVVITSPPYPNRMSYIRELRPYMYWLGYLNDGRAAGELDWKAIGGTWGCATSMLGTWSPQGNGKIPFPNFDRMVGDIGQGHPLLGRYVHKYFQDIKGHITGLRNVLAPGARCHYIVGNSKFYDTMVPVERIYSAIFEDAGFVAVTVETIRKRTSKKELFEFIVHANAPDT